MKYEVIEVEGELLIQGTKDNCFWLVECVFELNEREYAEAFCRLLNKETERAYSEGDWDARKELYDRKGVL